MRCSRPYQQVALLLQGGGALGSYHVGVYETLAAAGIEPTWISGVSIGGDQHGDHRRQSAGAPAWNG